MASWRRAGASTCSRKSPRSSAGASGGSSKSWKRPRGWGCTFQNRYNQSVHLLKEVLALWGRRARCWGPGLVTWHREAPYYTESGWQGQPSRPKGGRVLISSPSHPGPAGAVPGQAHLRGGIGNHHLGGVIRGGGHNGAYLPVWRGHGPVLRHHGPLRGLSVLVELVCENATLRMEGRKFLSLEGRHQEHFSLAQPKAPATGRPTGASHSLCIRDFTAACGRASPSPMISRRAGDTVG